MSDDNKESRGVLFGMQPVEIFGAIVIVILIGWMLCH
jgi:hypothetical protein